MAKRTSKKTSTKRTAKSGKSGDVSAALAELNDVFETTKPKTGGGGLPDGKFQVMIEEADIGHAQSGRLQVVFKLKVAGGEFINRVAYKRDGIDNEDAIGWFKSGLERLGVETDGLKGTDYPGVLKELVGSFCEITAKNKADSDYTNYYFNKALDDDEVDTEGLDDIGDDGDDDNGEGGGDSQWSVGDAVQVDFDGDYYTGAIESVDDGEEQASIKFEDGSTEDVAYADIERFSPDDDGGEEEVEETEADDSEGEEEDEGEAEGITLSFDDEGVSSAQEKTLTKLASDNDFNADDYETWCELITDIFDYLEVGGTFKTCAAAIKAIKSAGS